MKLCLWWRAALTPAKRRCHFSTNHWQYFSLLLFPAILSIFVPGMLLSTSVFYHIAAVASWAILLLSMAIEKPNAAAQLSVRSSPNLRIANRDLPFFQNLVYCTYNQATPLAIDRLKVTINCNLRYLLEDGYIYSKVTET